MLNGGRYNPLGSGRVNSSLGYGGCGYVSTPTFASALTSSIFDYTRWHGYGEKSEGATIATPELFWSAIKETAKYPRTTQRRRKKSSRPLK